MIYNIILVSGVQQTDLAIHIYLFIYMLLKIIFHYRLLQNIEYSSSAISKLILFVWGQHINFNAITIWHVCAFGWFMFVYGKGPTQYYGAIILQLKINFEKRKKFEQYLEVLWNEIY